MTTIKSKMEKKESGFGKFFGFKIGQSPKYKNSDSHLFFHRDSEEISSRLLGDFNFLLGNYKAAIKHFQNFIDLLLQKKDARSSRYLGHCYEIMSLVYYLNDGACSKFFNFLNAAKSNYYKNKNVLGNLRLCGWLVGVIEKNPLQILTLGKTINHELEYFSLFSAIFTFKKAQLFEKTQYFGQRMQRKFGLCLVLSAFIFSKLGFSFLASDLFCEASELYKPERGWFNIDYFFCVKHSQSSNTTKSSSLSKIISVLGQTDLNVSKSTKLINKLKNGYEKTTFGVSELKFIRIDERSIQFSAKRKMEFTKSFSKDLWDLYCRCENFAFEPAMSELILRNENKPVEIFSETLKFSIKMRNLLNERLQFRNVKLFVVDLAMKIHIIIKQENFELKPKSETKINFNIKRENCVNKEIMLDKITFVVLDVVSSFFRLPKMENLNKKFKALPMSKVFEIDKNALKYKNLILEHRETDLELKFPERPIIIYPGDVVQTKIRAINKSDKIILIDEIKLCETDFNLKLSKRTPITILKETKISIALELLKRFESKTTKINFLVKYQNSEDYKIITVNCELHIKNPFEIEHNNDFSEYQNLHFFRITKNKLEDGAIAIKKISTDRNINLNINGLEKHSISKSLSFLASLYIKKNIISEQRFSKNNVDEIYKLIKMKNLRIKSFYLKNSRL
ncbi:hypothetical protein MHBO_000819 [Bonamia ostreae]|uniref:Trafficking protein particle complex subunit 11 domain-containing protein n=1 Tax=Bonamia ostreae TaxID=126728 RepID=A0ABV2AGX2_9EUKA